jgi:hypothetical protein
MKAALFADEEDRRGFALAGLTGPPCRDGAELDHALKTVGDDLSAGLLVVTAAAARLGPRALDVFRREAGATLVLVLPEPAEADGAWLR